MHGAIPCFHVQMLPVCHARRLALVLLAGRLSRALVHGSAKHSFAFAAGAVTAVAAAAAAVVVVDVVVV